MCKRIKMFSDTEKTVSFLNKETQRPEYRLSREDSLKCYKALIYRKVAPGENICEFGEIGDRFYIILEGDVSILRPREVVHHHDTYWDVWNDVLRKHEKIRIYRDDDTRAFYMAMETIGVDLLRSLAFKSLSKLIEFLRKIELTDPDLFNKHKELDLG